MLKSRKLLAAVIICAVAVTVYRMFTYTGFIEFQDRYAGCYYYESHKDNDLILIVEKNRISFDEYVISSQMYRDKNGMHLSPDRRVYVDKYGQLKIDHSRTSLMKISQRNILVDYENGGELIFKKSNC